MACSQEQNCKVNRKNNEIIVGNTLFSYTLTDIGNGVSELAVTPCNTPTSVYCVARITTRENCCNNMQYYQSFINTDPVQIIQDCSLDEIICRSIENYFENIPTIDTRSCNNRRCSFGLF